MERERVDVIVNADQGVHTIDRNIYGHFSEHLGRCIYGGIWAGRDSSIPNTRGVRRDVVEALRKIRLPVLRWPGGCFADEYHWRDGIGNPERRPKMINTHWGDVVEDNSFGTHEFLDACEQIGCEPYICGNVGSGTVREMSSWVEYVNSSGTPMAALRAENGRKAPWGVTYWGVGNENWGCGGRMRPEYYADLYRRYGLYCRDYGESKLFRIACGPNSDEYHWTEVLMREAGRFMDGLALHYYTSMRKDGRRYGSATEFDEDEWYTILKKALHMEELIRRHGVIMDRYDPEKRVALVVDEWGTWYEVEPGTNPRFLYQQNTIRDALVAGLTLNIFNNHADRVRMGNLAQTVNVLQALVLTEEKGDRMVLTPTYHVFDMYRVHQDATLLPSVVQGGRYEREGDSMPLVSVSGSRDATGRVHVTLCNTHPGSEIPVTCHIRGMKFSTAAGTILTADTINAHNTFDIPDAVIPVALPPGEFTVSGETVTVQIPARSVVSLSIC